MVHVIILSWVRGIHRCLMQSVPEHSLEYQEVVATVQRQFGKCRNGTYQQPQSQEHSMVCSPEQYVLLMPSHLLLKLYDAERSAPHILRGFVYKIHLIPPTLKLSLMTSVFVLLYQEETALWSLLIEITKAVRMLQIEVYLKEMNWVAQGCYASLDIFIECSLALWGILVYFSSNAFHRLGIKSSRFPSSVKSYVEGKNEEENSH